MFPQAPLPYEINPIFIETQKVEVAEPKPKFYVIVEGDNLTKIAKAQAVPLERLWAANPELTNPDLIKPSQSLKIPLESDVLEARPFPATIEKSVSPILRQTSAPSGRSSVSGNTYTPGQCTWGVKNWRPDIPNGWGNASAWVSNARKQGWATGSTPKVGAVGWTNRHVVLVVGVSGNTVTIKEMNYNYVPYSVRTIDKPASMYVYIY